MKTVKTILRLIAICVAGIAGVFLPEMIVPAVAVSFPDDPVGPPQFYASLIGGVGGSLAACLMLVPTADVSLCRRVLAVVLSPVVAGVGIALYWFVTSRMEVVHPWEGLIFPILWAFVTPLSTYLGYHLPLRRSGKS